MEQTTAQKMARRLWELRRVYPCTQRELAIALNVTERTIGAWERAENEIGAAEQRALTEIFDISLAVLAGDERIPEPNAARTRRFRAEIERRRRMEE